MVDYWLIVFFISEHQHMLTKMLFARFCVSLHRFRGAETILKALYDHLTPPEQLQKKESKTSQSQSVIKQNHLTLSQQDQKKESKAPQNSPERKQKLQPYPKKSKKKESTVLQLPPPKYRLLSSKIRDAITQQVDLKRISQSVADEFINMYDPSKGTTFDDEIKSHQPGRFDQAKNNSDRYPFFSGSALMSVLMRQYYKYDKTKKFFINNSRRRFGEHFVSTPGLGKTFKFLQIAYLHDIRVKHIIEKGIPKDEDGGSLFKQNIKFVYFNVETQKQLIMETLKEKYIEDFGQGEIELKQLEKFSSQNNFIQFLKTFVKCYRKKGILIRPIIDQVNNLYGTKIQSASKKAFIQNWKTLLTKSGCYGTVVSSKNIEYRKTNDPILRIVSAKQNDENMVKVVLDNLISPADRLLYSAECLLFELEKQNVPKITGMTAFSIAKKLEKQLSFLTHYAISMAVSKSIKLYKPGKDYQSILKICFEENEDKTRLLRNIKQFSKKIEKSNLIKNPGDSISIMANLISFTCQAVSKQKIRVYLEVGDAANPQLLNIESSILKRALQSQESILLLDIIKNTNFFFLATVDNIQMVYFNQSPSYLQTLRMELMNFFTIDFQIKLIQHMHKQAIILLSDRAGLIFEMLICKAFDDFKQKYRTFQTIIKLINGQQFIINMNRYSISQEEFPSIAEQVRSKTVSKLKTQILLKNCFLRAADGNPTFDFLISTCDDHKLSLFFIDATIQKSANEKKNRFVKYLSGGKVQIYEPVPKKQNATGEQSVSTQKAQEPVSKRENAADVQTAQTQKAQEPVPKKQNDTDEDEDDDTDISQNTLNRLAQIIKNFESSEGINQLEIYFYALQTRPAQQIAPTTKTQVIDLTAKFQKSQIFSSKLKVVKMAQGFIDDDFHFDSGQMSDLSSAKIVQIMKPALKHHQNNPNQKQQGKK